jgi:hypothetical protein
MAILTAGIRGCRGRLSMGRPPLKMGKCEEMVIFSAATLGQGKWPPHECSYLGRAA